VRALVLDRMPEKRIRVGASAAQRRALRRNPTDAERLLWAYLRSRQIANFKFRRQHAIGPYVLDFYCAAQELGVELDGGQHYTLRGRRMDEARARYLAERGARVLRFSDHDVLTNLQGVIDAISEALTPASPTPVGEGPDRPPLDEARTTSFIPPESTAQ
jgi:very-short-patch-repair endonuclease